MSSQVFREPVLHSPRPLRFPSQNLTKPSRTMSSPVAPKLRVLLDRKNITARDLAGRIGMDESTVSLWLSGKRTPRVKALEKIAKALEIDLAEIWTGPEATPASAVQAAMLEEMNTLTPAQQEALLALARSMRSQV